MIGKLIKSALTAIPLVVSAVKSALAKRPLDAPLGESEAARALREEEDRRARARERS